MAKAVLTTKVDPSYDDLPEERYHFPRTYLNAVRQESGVSLMEARMTADRISELVAAGESETLEFKRTTGQPTPGDQAWSLRANGTAGLSLATTGRTGGRSPPGPGRPLVSLGPPGRIAREGGGVKPGLQDGNSGCHDGGSARVLPRCQRRAKRRLPNGPGSSQRLTGLRRRRRDRVRGGPNCGWPVVGPCESPCRAPRGIIVN